jgi:DNA-binding CsgD family transcriptional regulator
VKDRGRSRKSSGKNGSAELERGRQLYERHAWGKAHDALTRADETKPLDADDLDRLALSAALSGRDEDFLKALERAHHAHLDADRPQRAARAAFWLGMRLAFLGEPGRASGWFGRAHRVLEREDRDCAERGYMLLPAARQQLVAGEGEAAYAAAAEAAKIGERFEDADLTALSRMVQGQALVSAGKVEGGLALLDEAMVAVTAGEVSPLVTGVIYCSVITSCQQVYAFGRAREWNDALASWCEEQPDADFAGYCLVHRAEILQLSGDWRDAIAAARRAAERFVGDTNRRVTAASARYQEAEIHRLRGEFAEADDAYREAGRLGREPQPGLALLRLAQGRADTAAVQVRRSLETTKEPLPRARLLPAAVEILLAAGELEEARRAGSELQALSQTIDIEVLRAMAAHASGAVALAEGDAAGALGPLRESLQIWQRVGAPYIAARLRVSIGQACRALGDRESAALELEGARAEFEELGAAPDLSRLNALAQKQDESPARPHGLTTRELQVLRLVAAGKTNKAIASELFLSEKTVDRHVSNIFVKLDVPSRAAATAFAYKHELV